MAGTEGQEARRGPQNGALKLQKLGGCDHSARSRGLSHAGLHEVASCLWLVETPVVTESPLHCPNNTEKWALLLPLFTDGETEARKSEVTCPRSQSR